MKKNSVILPKIFIDVAFNGYSLSSELKGTCSALELIEDPLERILVRTEAHLKVWPDKDFYVVLSNNGYYLDHNHKGAFNIYCNVKSTVKGVYKVIGLSNKKILLGGLNLSGGLCSNAVDFNLLNIKQDLITFKVV